MRNSTSCTIALVTAPDLETARKIAKVALEKRLAACANLIPQLESHYWWQGKLESAAEIQMIFKTTRDRLPELRQCVIENHPYEVAEFLALEVEQGSEPYLAWVRESVAPP